MNKSAFAIYGPILSPQALVLTVKIYKPIIL